MDLSLKMVWEHTRVVTAKWIWTFLDKAPTHQVVVEVMGPMLEKLDLGPWGKYSMWPYDRATVLLCVSSTTICRAAATSLLGVACAAMCTLCRSA